MGGGLSGFKLLSPTPAVIHLNLNEWVRFEQPGNYTVVVTSHRAGNNPNVTSAASHAVDFTLISTPIHLTIVPANGEWQDAKLATIVNELKATPGATESRQAAVADLRYLGTPAAAQVMAQHLRDDEPAMVYPCAFGLMGLPDAVHPKAIAAMNKLIGDPDFPVSWWFLTTLTTLQIVADTPEKQRADRERLSQAVWELALKALPAKKRGARAETAKTLSSAHSLESTPLMKAELGGVLRDTFSDLPADRQLPLLQSNWDLIQSPSLLPALQALAKKPLKNPGSNESKIYEARELKSIALERWYQLDPDGARQEVLRQIGSAHPSMTAESLHFLGDQRLPEFENTWASALAEATDYQQESVLVSLLAHYGTGAALTTVRAKLETNLGEWACAPQGAALGYLVKFDPTSARALVEQAVQARGPGKSACNHTSFQDIARYSHDPMLREVAIEALNDPDPEVTLDGLNYLTYYGDAFDQQPIANRYAEWSLRWRGRADELRLPTNWHEVALGDSLVRALIANQAWLASEPLIQNTVGQCIGEQMCQGLKQIVIRSQSRPYFVSGYKHGENEGYHVAQYAPKSLEQLEAKLAQFPKGTRFAMTNNGAASEEQKQLDDKLRDLLEKHGMVLVRDPQ